MVFPFKNDGMMLKMTAVAINYWLTYHIWLMGVNEDGRSISSIDHLNNA